MTNPQNYTEEYPDEKSLYDITEIPPQWSNIPIPIIRLALTFGLLIPEYTLKDYILLAAENPQRCESVDVWGVVGSGKSNYCLQMAYWVYQDWDACLKEICFMPNSNDYPQYAERGFLQKLKTISKNETQALLIWDDLIASMPSSTFKTDIEVYGAIDSAWAIIRTKVKIMLLNNPLIDRIAKNIKDNVSMEVMIGPNQTYQVERWVRLIGLGHENSNFFKIQVEPLNKFNLYNVPTNVFNEYNDLRREIGDFVIHKLGVAFNDEASIAEDMMNPTQVCEYTGLSMDGLIRRATQGFITGNRINKKLYYEKKDVEILKQTVDHDNEKWAERKAEWREHASIRNNQTKHRLSKREQT